MFYIEVCIKMDINFLIILLVFYNEEAFAACPGLRNLVCSGDTIINYLSASGNDPTRSCLDSSDGWFSGSQSDYIELHLQNPHIIRGITTRGHGALYGWITSYKLNFTVNGNWVRYQQNDVDFIFTGNYDSDTVMTNAVNFPMEVTIVRLEVYTVQGNGGLRWEVYGTPVNEEVCSFVKPLFCENGSPKTAVTASSELFISDGYIAFANQSCLMASGFWCPSASDTAQWIMLHFSSPVTVVGVLTRGRGGSNQFTTSFNLQFRKTDTEEWNTASFNKDVTLFPGNQDDRSIKFNWLYKPVVGRYIQLIPVSWSGHICLRWEVLGCDDAVTCSNLVCANNGAYKPGKDLMICDCTGTGYKGKACNEDVNECKDKLDKCPSGSKCQNIDGGFLCIVSDRTAVIVLGLLVGLLVIALVIVIYCVYIRNMTPVVTKDIDTKSETYEEEMPSVAQTPKDYTSLETGQDNSAIDDEAYENDVHMSIDELRRQARGAPPLPRRPDHLTTINK